MQRTSTDNWLGLAGNTYAVTGAASGIGAAIATGLVRAGARVALLDINARAVTERALMLTADGPGEAVGWGCDVTRDVVVVTVAEQVRERLGPCSGIVNNAGILRPGWLATVGLDEWNQSLAVNLTGYLVAARAFLPQMTTLGVGSIVNVASISATHPQTGSGAYSASKAGVLLMSRQMAAEWGPTGIRSNALCPGMIRTALSAKFYEEPGFEERRAQVTASRRIGLAQDIAGPALFLLSDWARYVNGAEILVDGGLNTMLMDLVPRPGFNGASVPTEKVFA